MAKSDYTIHEDGSVTFHTDTVDPKTREKAYAEAAKARSKGTDVEEEVTAAARESAELVSEREKATEA